MVFRSWLAVIILACGFALWAEEPEIAASALPDTLAEESDWADAKESMRKEPTKVEILGWIKAKQNLKAEQYQAFVQDAFAPSVYAFKDNYTELYSDPYRISLYGFEHISTLLERGLYLGNFERHYIAHYRAATLDFQHFDYPYPVSVSGMQGTLGDYDTRDLAAFFARQGLFGVEDFSLYTDFSLQNAYWLDSPRGSSSLRTLFIYYAGGWDFRTEYASIKNEPGSLELLPNYRSTAVYSIKQDYSHLYLKAQSPWLELALLRSREKAQSSRWQQELKSSNTQISARKALEYGAARLDMRYEYADIQRNYDLVNSYNQMDYRHKLSMDLSFGRGILFDCTPELLDWKYLRSESRICKSWGALRLGLYDKRIFSSPNVDYKVQNPLNGNNMSGLEVNQDWESGVLGGWQQGVLSANLAAGYQKLSQTSLIQDLADKQFILRVNGRIHPRLGDWELEIAPSWIYQDNKLYLMENPRFRFGSRQALTRYLSHDNALSCGFDIQGHSNYYMANVSSPVLIEASTMLDFWTKVKIGQLFDFTVQYQNLLNTSLYGVYPIPPSFHAGINWYFIN